MLVYIMRLRVAYQYAEDAFYMYYIVIIDNIAIHFKIRNYIYTHICYL